MNLLRLPARRRLTLERLEDRQLFATLALSNQSVAENATAAVIGNVTVDGALVSSTSVTVNYTAKVATVAGTPFGFTSAQARLQPVTGSFTYNLNTADTNATTARGDYKHSSGGAFVANLLGLTIAGSGAPYVQIEDFSAGVSDTFRFNDGPRVVGPAGGIMTVNGTSRSDVELGISFSDGSGNAFTTDALPNPLPFAVAPLNTPSPFWFPHTFSIKDAGGTLLLQLDSLTMAESYTLTASDSRFEIAGSQLKLKAGQSLNFEAEPTVPLTVTATSSSSVVSSQAFVLNVTNVNEAPTSLNLSRASVFSNLSGAWVASVTWSDPDAGDTHTVSVNDTRFAVTQGNLYLKPGQSLAAGTPSVNLQLTVRDAGNLSLARNFTLTVQAAPANWTHAHQWKLLPADVDADGVVAPLDALLVINALNSGATQNYASAVPGTQPPLFLDVSGDDAANPLDALTIINFLNSGGASEAQEEPQSALKEVLAEDVLTNNAMLAWLSWKTEEDQASKVRAPRSR